MLEWRQAALVSAAWFSGETTWLRSLLDVPKPKYGGAPNLCEDLYWTGFPSLLKRILLEACQRHLVLSLRFNTCLLLYIMFILLMFLCCNIIIDILCFIVMLFIGETTWLTLQVDIHIDYKSFYTCFHCILLYHII